MIDIVDTQTRARMMSGIRGKNTSPELTIRKALHAQGFRFRLHADKLPGKPDLVLPKYRAVIFIHGCFWHGHNCRYFKMPKTRPEFWESKISKNRIRDQEQINKLGSLGWRVLIIWECAVRRMSRTKSSQPFSIICRWIVSDSKILEISESTIDATA